MKRNSGGAMLVALATLWLTAASLAGAGNRTRRACGDASGFAAAADAKLRCVALLAPPAFPGASGTVELIRLAGPFTFHATVDGRERVRLVVHADGLPTGDDDGPFDRYGVWVSGPGLTPLGRLATLEPDLSATGVVAWNQWKLFVVGERSGDTTVEATGFPGPVLLRGESPSMRMRPADFLEFALGAAPQGMAHDGHANEPGPAWTGVPMPPGIQMLPALMRLRPDVSPWLPVDSASSVPEIAETRRIRLATGDTLRLEAAPVRHTVDGRSFVLYGFNGQIPGPVISVERRAEVTVVFRNSVPWPTAVHWHGLRLDNASDGVPFLTQAPVQPGETFTYTLTFPDAGVYWYHPHHREDLQQDLGLYGNMLVEPDAEGGYGPVHREELWIVDDLLVGADGLVPFGREAATHQLSGRFGNVMLVNGRSDFRLRANAGEIVRFFLTNVSNTRVFNLSFDGLPMKLVGSDVGTFEREAWVESVVIAPAERYVVHVRFDRAGEVPLLNRVQAIDHLNARFLPVVDTLATVAVDERPVQGPDLAAEFDTLREHAATVRDIDDYRRWFDRPVDRRLELLMRPRELPLLVERLMQVDSSWFAPVEWAGTMPMMNWMSTPTNLEWVLRDPDSGLENLDIDWRFAVGDVVRVRLTNRADVLHAMQHPIHLHGQRFLILSQDGVENTNLVWKDTALVPVGSTIDLLLDVTNPGGWMLHCHIAEHLEAGMKMVFRVSPVDPG